MNNNVWTLYNYTGLTSDKNFLVENIEDYLETIPAAQKQVILEGQYIKHALALNLRININQNNLNFFNVENAVDYISIKNGEDTLPVYYFVMSKTWISSNCISFTLKMDTLNTFKIGSNYKFSNKTLVTREHKDRFGTREEYEKGSEIVTPYYDDTILEFLTKDKDKVIFDLTLDYIEPLSTIGAWDNDTNENKLAVYFVNKTTLKRTNDFGVWAKIQLTEKTVQGMNFALYDNETESWNFFTIDNKTMLNSYMILEAIPLDNPESEYNGYEGGGNDFARFYAGILLTTNKPYRKIDLYSEGFNPVLYGDEKGVIEDDSLDWFLIYRNRDIPSPDDLDNPVECFIAASSPILVNGISGIASFTPEDLTSGTYEYLFYYQNNPEAVIEYVNKDDEVIQLKLEIGIIKDATFGKRHRYRNACFYLEDSKITLRYNEKLFDKTLSSIGDEGYFSRDSGHHAESSKMITIKGIKNLAIYGGNTLWVSSINPALNTERLISTITSAGTSQDIHEESMIPTITINEVNREDSRIIKIIKLPYCPVEYSDNKFSNYEFRYDNNYQLPKLIDTSSKFKRTITSNLDPLSPIHNLTSAGLVEATTESERSIERESKLYHSDYYQPKFVYDSFGFVFQLEKVNIEEFFKLERYDEFTITYNVTSTINSRFMFTFNNYTCDGLSSEDYNNILPIARNNELTLYNSAYINYLKTGFNYDVKTKNRTESSAILGTVLSLIGSVASFASAGATGGVGIAAGIGLATSTAAQFASTVNTIQQSEQNLEAKQAQLQMQAASVSGADDIDLMSEYTQNKAKYMLYKVSERMREALYNMFFFTGYKTNEMKIPNFNSRVWFNFIACEAVFTEVFNISDNCLEDLKEHYRGGVTVFHKHNNKWDMLQEYENFETSLNIPDPS